MKKIAFEDIRKGMTVAAVNPELIDRGVSYPRVGVVYSQDQAGDWMTDEENHLTYREFGEVDDYYLISGPSLPEEPGSVIANVVLSDEWVGEGAFTSEDTPTAPSEMYRVVFNDNRELHAEEIDIHELEQEAGPDGWFYIEKMHSEVPEEPEDGEQQDGPLPAVP